MTFRRKVKNWLVVGNPEPEELGLLANLCSLCTFNLCSVEETNTLGTSLKLEVSEQRTIPFPSPFHVDWLPGEQKPLPAAACQLLPSLPPSPSPRVGFFGLLLLLPSNVGLAFNYGFSSCVLLV